MTQKKVSLVWMPLAVILCILAVGFIAHDLMESPETVIPDGYINEQLAQDAVNDIIAEADSQIAGLNARITELLKPIETVVEETVEEVAEAIEKAKELAGYLIDEVFLSDPLDEETYSDREVKTLFDGEVSFDGEDYDVEETLILDGIKLVANGNDFEGNVYATFPENSVEYTVTFDSDLNTTLIGDNEEYLEFSFLGMNYEVTKWETNKITLNKGTEQKLTVGETIDVDGSSVTLDAIADDKIFVCVDGTCKSISEEQTKTVNGIEISVNSVFNSDTYQFAYLTVGDEVELVIEHEEEYEEDSAWEYVITANSIGVILVEDFDEVDLDGDEEFQAIAVGEGLSLPNAYLGIVFNGMVSEDSEEYNLELDDRDGPKVKIDGNFQSGTSDYERVYVNVSGIYDKDSKLIHATTIKLGDTDSNLTIDGTWLYFEDFEVNYALNDASANGNSLNSFDEKYTSDYGLTIEDPESMVEDKEFTIFVNEKQLEGSISLI